MTSETPLGAILQQNLTTMKISKQGDWLIFVTAQGDELRFCCHAVVGVPIEDYWNNYADDAYESYQLEQD